MTKQAVRPGVVVVRHEQRELRVEVAADGAVTVLPGGEHAHVTRLGDDTYRVTTASASWHVVVAAVGDRRQAFVDGEVFDLEVGPAPRTRAGTRRQDEALVAPMPARVREVCVEVGQTVAAGDVLLTLEAMKMELAVRAPRDGRVASIRCRAGELVPQGVPLLELE